MGRRGVHSGSPRCQCLTACVSGAAPPQAEELVRLQDQASGLGQELGAERTRSTGLQEALEQSQQARSTLQEHVYGKESEVSALRQDLKVGP